MTGDLTPDDPEILRIRVVESLDDDLFFYENLTVSLEHPGDQRFTLLDPRKGMIPSN